VSLKEQVFSDPVFKPLLEIDDQLVSAELKEKRTRLDVGIEAQALAVQLALKPLSYRADRIRRHSFKGGALVKDQGAATYLNALSLTVQKSGDQVHVKFKLGEGKTFVGCVNQNTGLSCASALNWWPVPTSYIRNRGGIALGHASSDQPSKTPRSQVAPSAYRRKELSPLFELQ
jgi:hypothetical protein